jgi:type IX secretion system PorP/SprF family membrane protein
LKKLLYIIILLTGFLLEASSQQVPLYSQYMLNGFLLNPAVAGSEGYTAVNLTAREQWIGMTHAPGTYALSFQTRILKKSYISRGSSVRRRKANSSRSGKVGVGGYLFSDRNGAVERTGLKATYAYHINFNHSQLSFGLSAVAYQFSLNEDLIKLADPGDELWLGAHKSVLIPDADFGVYYTARNYWGGFSVDQLFESILKIGDSGYDRYKMERNYYLIGGYDFEVNRDLIFSPSTLLKYAENGKFQADVSGKFYFQQTYWAGLTYRTGQAIIVLAGVSIDKFVFGYAFDIGLNSIMKHSFGTHEFTFIAKFGDNARRYKWLNRF